MIAITITLNLPKPPKWSKWKTECVWMAGEGALVPMETGSRYSSQSQMGLCLHCVQPKSYFSFRFWINLWTRFVFQSELTEIPLMGLLLFCANTKSENTSTISNIVSWSLGRNLSGENSIVLSDTLKSDLEKLPLHLKSDIVSCCFWCLISNMEKISDKTQNLKIGGVEKSTSRKM